MLLYLIKWSNEAFCAMIASTLKQSKNIAENISLIAFVEIKFACFRTQKQINYNYLIGILLRKCANCLKKNGNCWQLFNICWLSHLILKDFHILNAFKFLQSLYSSVSFPSNYLCYCSILPASANFNQEKNKERMSEVKWMGRFIFSGWMWENW